MNKEVKKVKKDGSLSHQGEGGGNYTGTQGRKPSIQKIKDTARQRGWDIFRVELAKSAWSSMDELIHDPDPHVRLGAIKLAWAYAYGKPKDSIDHTIITELSLSDLCKKASRIDQTS